MKTNLFLSLLLGLLIFSSCGNFKLTKGISKSTLHEFSNNEVEVASIQQNESAPSENTFSKKDILIPALKELVEVVSESQPEAPSQKFTCHMTEFEVTRSNISDKNKKRAASSIIQLKADEEDIKATNNLFMLALALIVLALVTLVIGIKTRKDAVRVISLGLSFFGEIAALIVSGIAVKKINGIEESEKTKFMGFQKVIHWLNLIIGGFISLVSFFLLILLLIIVVSG